MPEDNRTIADDLLPGCSVRIDVADSPKGSGFFAAPGTVITCAHVIESKRLSSTDVGTAITVVDSDGNRYPVEPVKQVWPTEDLAVLKLSKSHGHPCVLFSSGLQALDPLHSFGYPEGHPEGVPTTLDAEGEVGGDRGWFKLKGGQVQPGMSGSAILNRRTGAVCGILKRTRDERQSLGGYAIPLTALLRLDPTLITGNQRYHERDHRWLDLLTLEQRKLLQVSWTTKPPSTELPTKQFVVSVGETEHGWEVSAHTYPEGSQIAPVRVDLNNVRRQVARLFRDWASRGRVHEGEQIRLLGGILSSAVFPQEVGLKLESLLREREEERILVSLRFEAGTDEDLIQLPWEHLYLPDRGEIGEIYLATDTRISFSRAMLKQPVPADEPSALSRLTVLVVAVSPRQFTDDSSGSQGTTAAHIDTVVQELKKTAGSVNRLEIEVIENPDPEALEQKVASGLYTIVHYVGLGSFRGDVDELALGADTRDGIDYVPIEVFAACLAEGVPQIVVLQLCEAPSGGVPADFALMAPTLVKLPIPAVVADQYPLIPKLTAKFNQTFYKQLAEGSSVDKAVQQARKRLWIVDRSSRAFLSPALFLRSPGEVRVARPVGDVAPLPQQSAYVTYG